MNNETKIQEELLNEILKDTYTIGDLKKRFLGLKLELQKKIYHSVKSVESVGSVGSVESEELDESKVSKASDDVKVEGKATVSEETAKWIRDFSPEMKEKINDKNYSEVCAFIEDVINKGTTLAIFFVFIPDVSQVEGFGKWLREHLKNPELLFDVKIDSSLIGGCAISYKGVYKDYSLKARIGANKQHLMEEFRGYLRK